MVCLKQIIFYFNWAVIGWKKFAHEKFKSVSRNLANEIWYKKIWLMK